MMINNNVYDDYRDNILVDKDNPVLAFKANRDRYFKNGNQDDYAGKSHLGSINSEDAITWNLIRNLSLSNDFTSLENLIGLKLTNPKVLLWTLSFDDKSNELQYIVGSTIRNIDGKYKGQITEPDIVIESDSHFIVFECKLGEINKFPNHLWESSKDSDGPRIREKDYFKDKLFTGNSGYDSNMYQLFRMVFYANEIANKLNKKALFVSLTNKTWWDKKKRNSSSPCSIWEYFKKQVNTDKVELINVFWQDLVIQNKALSSYIENHRCLKI
ncbi:MAG: hypothetical protein ACOZDD_13950 [Bacteroidota bacterium]